MLLSTHRCEHLLRDCSCSLRIPAESLDSPLSHELPTPCVTCWLHVRSALATQSATIDHPGHGQGEVHHRVAACLHLLSVRVVASRRLHLVSQVETVVILQRKCIPVQKDMRTRCAMRPTELSADNKET
jgi:hypothetical protein